MVNYKNNKRDICKEQTIFLLKILKVVHSASPLKQKNIVIKSLIEMN